MVEEMARILEKIESEIRRGRPKTLIEALEYETKNLYMYYALKIARGKLVNNLRQEDIDSVKSLKKYFKMVQENKGRVDSEDDQKLLKRLYGDDSLGPGTC